jgi:CBS domain-containing protein
MTLNAAVTQDPRDAEESPTEMFHLVGNLIPEGQQVVSVHPDISVAQALALMEAHNFSQLPVSVNSLVTVHHRSYGGVHLPTHGRIPEHYLRHSKKCEFYNSAFDGNYSGFDFEDLCQYNRMRP